MSTESLLQIKDLELCYGSSHVLHGVSLRVEQKPLGILGRNGMGKTSLCQAVIGMHPSSAGTIHFAGEDITTLPPEKRAQMGIAYVPQGRRVFRSLTVAEHLQIVAHKGSAWSIDRVYEIFPRLKERRHNLGDRLSGGEQQMLAIGRALLLNPRLIVLDEPTEGLAPAIVSEVIDLIKMISDEGIAVLLVEQNMHAALAAVQDVAIMVGGEVVETCTAEALERDAALQKRHLGLEPGQKD
ncbi:MULTISPECIES: ABC transporter ATP-binding protein [Pacificibacter]|uniref:ABC transporter ATP-binding protein n=1 Tax=Pacificibacter TaxID=1042323 RepID=UPI001C094B52|nr:MULTISPECIES: ABC transporter ATP-binding protein [Pacificibacter]MBU2936374.1 ABC transporter ATP-binding protein [Pacificibacter marinus]MDO6617339.1 ABC transporter ATP-binding protein [Pacificibacter sp. 1_MG-2023]